MSLMLVQRCFYFGGFGDSDYQNSGYVKQNRAAIGVTNDLFSHDVYDMYVMV